MELTIIIGYILAIIIGLSMGIMGSGGSIMTLPIFVYLFHIDPSHALVYSLFTIGVTALLGSINHIKNKQIDYRSTFLFIIPSLLFIYLTKQLILPYIPTTFHFGKTDINSSQIIMFLFAFVILSSSYAMINMNHESFSKNKLSYFKIMLTGAFIGLLTSLFGAGGGFIIVPALVVLLGNSIHQATSTSLFIIAINSIFGFLTNYIHFYDVNWTTLIIFTVITLIGLIIGIQIKPKLNSQKMKISFGYILGIIGFSIATIEMMHFINPQNN